MTGVELVCDSLQGVAAEHTSVSFTVKPENLNEVSVNEEPNGVPFLWTEEVVAYDGHTK